jgi:RNA-directed DNA polymerase
VLLYAFKKVKENRGTAGMDGVTVKDIELKVGVKNFVCQLQEELKTRKYRPQPVKRVYIPKADGRKRPLGIPTVRDRTVQMALLLVLEPIFETDFLDCSYGFRPNRSAHDALAEIRGNLKAGFHSVYDADLKGYFDSIPHDKLMACVRMRVADRQVLKLIRMWLEVPVVEMPKKRGKGGKPRWSRPLQGTPQGGVCTPLTQLATLSLKYV